MVRFHPPPPNAHILQLAERVDLESIQCRFDSYYGHLGVLAQLVEHLLCKQEVRGSSPLDSIVQEDKKSDVSDGVSITPISITWGCQVSTGHKGLIC